MAMRPSIWTALLLPVLVLAVADSQALQPAPGCQKSCGGMEVPFPFGIGDGCSLPGFEIDCRNGDTPMLADNIHNLKVLNLSVMPRPEARVMLPIALQCYNVTDGTGPPCRGHSVATSTSAPCTVSPTPATSSSCSDATLSSTPTAGRGVAAGTASTAAAYISYCDNEGSATDGACAGIGCCRVDIPPGLTDNDMTFSVRARPL
jgi:hypothetical protein